MNCIIGKLDITSGHDKPKEFRAAEDRLEYKEDKAAGMELKTYVQMLELCNGKARAINQELSGVSR